MTQKIVLTKENTTVSFLETGDLVEVISHEMMINQLNGNSLDGSLNQLYLRVYTPSGIQSIPMVGSNSPSTFAFGDDQLTWRGSFLNVRYQVDFKLAEADRWFWRIQLSGTGQRVDVIYGQDLGNATKGAVQSNEAYMSQYIDHHISREDGKIVISSRQNQPQSGKFPVVEQGSLQNLKSFTTDGYQFFGKQYKETNQPSALREDTLANEVYQYEFAYIALQTENIELTEVPTEIVFYAAVKDHQEEAIEGPIFTKEIEDSYQKLNFKTLTGDKIFMKNIGTPVVGIDFTEAEIASRFPRRRHEEIVSGKLYSFFTDNHHHVVLKEKEVEMERAHGHILLSGTDLTVDQPLLSTTLYMYGIFNSQVVLGNTTMNKLMSNSRNSLNIMKQSGQRIYLKEQERWRILTMPSAFEMGLNSATWFYKLEDDVIKVTTYTLAEGREIRTTLTSENGRSYTWAVTNQFLMGADEARPSFDLHRQGQIVTITGKKDTPTSETYPELTYYLSFDKPFEMTTETLFLSNHAADNLTVFTIENQANFSLRIQGNLDHTVYHDINTDFQQEDTRYLTFINELLHDFELHHAQEDVDKMNTLARWYTHNMLIHYLSPHGLEQYGGAAWGTRDVSQGPTEFFFAVNRPEIVASIIRHVYENQFADDGNWPQWFMFDRYEKQKADESHGDVIVWPMKIVADYLENTNDFTILESPIRYTERDTFNKTTDTATLYQHLQKEIRYIEDHFLEGTHLSCYGDGDWDDTLQPNNAKLKKQMASSWTVALTYQVLNKMSELLVEYDATYAAHLKKLVAGIKQDFEKFMLSTDTIPGFVYMENLDEIELMIHPDDQKTGIKYRLLPMTRSMIAELLTPEQVAHHLAIIKKNLQYPDGVRLMNRPASYQGGVSTNFKRAEQAANLGREIGLQYVHAHIRFTEAMAKIGESEETWSALNIINPIQIKEEVPNAALRQANVYFSSSDGDFKTRYEAQENFGKLKDGSIGVKGGWRIYSSGPGIYLNQLISNVLGIRENQNYLVIDPVLPDKLDGLTMRYQLFGKPVTLVFHLGTGRHELLLNGEKIVSTEVENPYRQGGIKVLAEDIEGKLQEANELVIYN